MKDLILLSKSSELLSPAQWMFLTNRSLLSSELLRQYLGTVKPFHPRSIYHDIVLDQCTLGKINDKIIFTDLSTLLSSTFRQFVTFSDTLYPSQ